MTRAGDSDYPIYCFHSTPTSFGRAKWGAVVMGMPSDELTLTIKSYELLGGLPYTPEPASINLHCPGCRREFSVQKDHLPFPGQTICPHCQHEADTAQFARFA